MSQLKRILILICYLIAGNSHAQCDLTPDDGMIGPVEMLVTNFEITNIQTTGQDCKIDYSVSYELPSTSCNVNYLQGLVRANGGSETSFNINQSGANTTVTGSIWNAPCSGSLSLFFNGGWGGSCPNTNVNYPGTECQMIAYGTLPIELTGFEVRKNLNNQSLDLNWTTSFETNIKQFEIQQSLDGGAFSTIAEIAPRNTMENIQRYQFHLRDPELGINYFRLKILDNNGVITYSEIQNITIRQLSDFVFPNPSAGPIYIRNWELANQMITVLSIDGQIVNQKMVNENGSLDLNIETPGIYLLIFGRTGLLPEKIIIQ